MTTTALLIAWGRRNHSTIQNGRHGGGAADHLDDDDFLRLLAPDVRLAGDGALGSVDLVVMLLLVLLLMVMVLMVMVVVMTLAVAGS